LAVNNAYRFICSKPLHIVQKSPALSHCLTFDVSKGLANLRGSVLDLNSNNPQAVLVGELAQRLVATA
jgi:hypothetical protein